MGILDSLENSAAFKGALGQLEAAVVPVVLSEVLGNGSQGGLSAIVAKLQQAGLGDQVKSWIGNGQNLPITAEQLQQVLGSDTVRQLAARFNIPVDQLAKVLAQQPAAAVDQTSPDGKLPHTAWSSGEGSQRRPGKSFRDRRKRAYRTEIPAKFSHLLCPDVTGQPDGRCDIGSAGVSVGHCSGTRGMAGVCLMGEGVEAQIYRWRNCLLHCQQCRAPGRQRHLRGDPAASDRW